MFDKMKDMGKMIKQAKEMRDRMKTLQDEMGKQMFEGESAKGRIKVVISGDLVIQSVTIDPSLLKESNLDPLQKSLVKATNDAIEKSKELASKQLSSISGDFNIPGLT